MGTTTSGSTLASTSGSPAATIAWPRVIAPTAYSLRVLTRYTLAITEDPTQGARYRRIYRFLRYRRGPSWR